MAWHRGQAYAQDLRDRVLRASGSIAEVAQRLEVSASYVSKVRARQRRLGLSTPGVQCNHVSPKLAGLEAALAAQVGAANDQTLAQLREWVWTAHGIRIGHAAMWRALHRLGLTVKKKEPARGRAAARGCRGPACGVAPGTADAGDVTADLSR